MAKNLNELVAARIEAKLSKGYKNANEARERLTAEGKISQDFIFEVGTDKKGIEKRIEFRPDIIPGIGAKFTFPKNEYGEVPIRDYRINQHAIRQVTERLNIPGVYLMALLNGQE